MGAILMAIFDAGILAIALQFISKIEVDFKSTAVFAFVASVGTNILAWVLTAALGWMIGLPIALTIAALLVGVAISALQGVEIKRAFLVGAIFIVGHVALSMIFYLMSSTPA